MRTLCDQTALETRSAEAMANGKRLGTCPRSFVASPPHPQNAREATNDGRSLALPCQRLGIITMYALAVLSVTGYIPGMSL